MRQNLKPIKEIETTDFTDYTDFSRWVGGLNTHSLIYPSTHLPI